MKNVILPCSLSISLSSLMIIRPRAICELFNGVDSSPPPPKILLRVCQQKAGEARAECFCLCFVCESGREKEEKQGARQLLNKSHGLRVRDAHRRKRE
jgi:hypothetical protein